MRPQRFLIDWRMLAFFCAPLLRVAAAAAAAGATTSRTPSYTRFLRTYNIKASNEFYPIRVLNKQRKHFIPDTSEPSAKAAEEDPIKVIGIGFYALSRNFSLRLWHPADVAPRKRISYGGAASTVEVDRMDREFYTGIVQNDESRSWVVARLELLAPKKVRSFEGSIYVDGETYFIEVLREREMASGSHARDVKHLVYRASDIEVKRKNWPATRIKFSVQIDAHEERKYGHVNKKVSGKKRGKRRYINKEGAANMPRVCTVHAMADYSYYRDIGTLSRRRTRVDMDHHFLYANEVLKHVDFNEDMKPDMIQLVPTKYTIFDKPAHPRYELDPNVTDSKIVLEQMAQFPDHSEYCIVLLFTSRNFICEYLGAANRASPKNTEYGICGQKSNALVVTQKYQDAPIVRGVTQVVVLHEVGHVFGANHDEDTQCNSDEYEMKNIMAEKAVDGQFPSHQAYSRCSIKAMHEVIKSRPDCLKHANTHPHCGDGFIDAGEQCDCGSVSKCKRSDFRGCCNFTTCQFARANSVCSPGNQPCCTSQCTFATPVQRQLCAFRTSCRNAQFCDGQSPDCPPPKTQTNGKHCGFDDEGKVCYMGECSDEVCAANGLLDCPCPPTSRNPCQVCCQRGHHQPCISAMAFNISGPDGGMMYRSYLYQCDDYRGYCLPDHTCIRDLLEDYYYPSAADTLTLDLFFKYLLTLVAALVFCNIAIAVLHVYYNRRQAERMIASELQEDGGELYDDDDALCSNLRLSRSHPTAMVSTSTMTTPSGVELMPSPSRPSNAYSLDTTMDIALGLPCMIPAPIKHRN